MKQPYQRHLDILYWTVPEAYWGLLSEVYYNLRFPHYARLLRRNRVLRGRHADRKRCFVIGNGPSLKKQDLKLLKNEISIAANSFFQHPDHAIVAPRYCCVADSEFTSGAENSIAWLREMEASLPSTTFLFQPAAEATFEKHDLFKKNQVHYFSTIYPARKSWQARVDLTRPGNVGVATGTVFSIPLALYLGFKEIYLVGFDANWLSEGKGETIHFYETNKYFPHFDNLWKEGKAMEFQLRTLHADFRSHHFLRHCAGRMGAQIINATEGGWLDMHPRIDYKSLF